MNKLISDSEVFQADRPLTITNQQRTDVLTEVAKNIIEWNLSKDSIETIVSDLDEVYSSGNSGFEMAKELDSSFNCSGSYDINSTLIESLEMLDVLVDDKNRLNTKEWVKAHGIKPKFKKGDEFTLKTSPFFNFEPGDKIFITIVNSEYAYYCINKDKNGNGGTVAYYEKLENCIN